MQSTQSNLDSVNPIPLPLIEPKGMNRLILSAKQVLILLKLDGYIAKDIVLALVYLHDRLDDPIDNSYENLVNHYTDKNGHLKVSENVLKEAYIMMKESIRTREKNPYSGK